MALITRRMMRLYRAMIYVKDLPRMTEFYSGMLGVKPVNEKWADEWAEFDTARNSCRYRQADRDFFPTTGT